MGDLEECLLDDDLLDEDRYNSFDDEEDNPSEAKDDSAYEDEYFIDKSSNRPMRKRKGINKSEEFFRLYGEVFEELISIPMIAMCKQNHELIPYEYSDRIIRFKRNSEEVDEFLKGDGKSLVIYCLKNRISKDLLWTVAGGNLFDYNQMKNSYGY